jgi:hypothetical protein
LGCERIEEVPADLMLAIEHAHRILTWRENLPDEEMPPTWMWHIESELDSWFKNVEVQRKNKSGGDDQDTGSSGGIQNEYTKGMRD